jgi:mannose-6-phosphate isomerase-like protein (cupin superfamily)
MDVRNVAAVEPEVEHNGTVPVWWLIKPREMFDLTDGGYLELANEFEVAVGGEVFPHSHPTHEFYFVMTGEGTMVIADEERSVAPGDLIHIPPDTVHSLRPTDAAPIHCFCFAVGVKDAPPIDYTTH